jgi:DivIVA domain-containing protein
MPPFTRRWFTWGYDRAEVDAFFANLATMPPDEIRTVKFKIRTFGGYDQQQVDAALDAWEQSS